MIVRDAHQSGFHGVTQPQWNAMLGSLAEHATVGVVTESRGLGVHLDQWASKGDETKVVFDAGQWQVEDSGEVSVPTSEWKRGRAKRTTVEVTWALLVHKKTGLRLLRLGGHLPAHLFLAAQRLANAQALAALRQIVLDLQREHHPNVTTASFDFNRDLRLKRNRELIAQSVRGTGLRLVVPPRGTLHLRKIDGFLTTGDLPVPSMMARQTRFDHRGTAMKSCGCPLAA